MKYFFQIFTFSQRKEVFKKEFLWKACLEPFVWTRAAFAPSIQLNGADENNATWSLTAPNDCTKTSELCINRWFLTSDSKQLLRQVRQTTVQTDAQVLLIYSQTDRFPLCALNKLFLHSYVVFLTSSSAAYTPTAWPKGLQMFSICTPKVLMNHVMWALAARCVSHRSVSIPALHVVWCQLPSPLPAASKFAYKWTSKRALWHNWLAIRNFLELVTLYWTDQVCKMRKHTHTQKERKMAAILHINESH